MRLPSIVGRSQPFLARSQPTTIAPATTVTGPVVPVSSRLSYWMTFDPSHAPTAMPTVVNRSTTAHRQAVPKGVRSGQVSDASEAAVDAAGGAVSSFGKTRPSASGREGVPRISAHGGAPLRWHAHGV